MKKNILLSGLLLIVLSVSAQQNTSNPDLQAMIETERAFARLAKEQNTRDAFLFYLTDDAVTAGPDGPVIGKEHLKKQKVGTAWLNWDVAYSDISSSGDLGYNTGPWEFRRSKNIDEQPVGFGEFNSIWKKQSDGTWKNAVDLGIGHGPGPLVSTLKLATSSSPLAANKKSKGKSEGKNEVTVIDKTFIDAFEKDKKAAYGKFLSKEARIVHSGQLPYVTSDEKQKFIASAETINNMEFAGGDVSSANDLGYVYGKGTVDVKTADKTETKAAIYFRVWKKEDGKNWKVVLDVLAY